LKKQIQDKNSKYSKTNIKQTKGLEFDATTITVPNDPIFMQDNRELPLWVENNWL
jgi:hypothetical protein